MALPTLTPQSQTSRSVLPVTGSEGNVNKSVPYKVYSDPNNDLFDSNFLSGAIGQVTYVFRKLGGDVLDIELTEANVYTAYEEAVLEYSYIVNVHQANNSLSSYLGHTTGTFDHLGQLKSTGETTLSSSLAGKHAALKYPIFDFGYARRVADAAGAEIGIGRGNVEYSASVDVVVGQQDYDLQAIIQASSSFAEYASGDVGDFHNKVGNKKILVKQVFYKTPQAMWRFFGYYGGLNVVGNLHNYGQFSDQSNMEVIPSWQNKLQAKAFEDSIYTRMSHFSYELKNNKLRLFPIPYSGGPKRMWVKFSIPQDPFDEEVAGPEGDGINNMNTLPFANLPYKSINSIGKQWIRRFALSLCKETLGQVRSKISTIPIPGESITLNGPALVSEAKEEQNALREELKTTLAEMTYNKLTQADSEMLEATAKIQENVPLTVFVG
tara:strand:- start:589 stop:1899 length:1311 start_codon:yes stop_codon:yes gene_type:complete